MIRLNIVTKSKATWACSARPVYLTTPLLPLFCVSILASSVPLAGKGGASSSILPLLVAVLMLLAIPLDAVLWLRATFPTSVSPLNPSSNAPTPGAPPPREKVPVVGSNL